MGWGWLSQTRPIPRSPDGDKKLSARPLGNSDTNNFFDGIYNVIWHLVSFWSGSVKKHPVQFHWTKTGGRNYRSLVIKVNHPVPFLILSTTPYSHGSINSH